MYYSTTPAKIYRLISEINALGNFTTSPSRPQVTGYALIIHVSLKICTHANRSDTSLD